MNSRWPSPGTLRPIIMMSSVVVALVFVATVASIMGRSDATTGAAAGCDVGRILSNDISESSGILPSGQQLRVTTVDAPGFSEGISVRKAVFAECTEGGALLVENGTTTLSWRTACGSGLLIRVGEDSVIVTVEDEAC